MFIFCIKTFFYTILGCIYSTYVHNEPVRNSFSFGHLSSSFAFWHHLWFTCITSQIKNRKYNWRWKFYKYKGNVHNVDDSIVCEVTAQIHVDTSFKYKYLTNFSWELPKIKFMIAVSASIVDSDLFISKTVIVFVEEISKHILPNRKNSTIFSEFYLE